MRILITAFLLAFSFAAFSQGSYPTDTTQMYKSRDYGWIHKRLLARVQLLPADTVANKNGLAAIGTSLYLGNGTRWFGISGGGGDTTSLSNRINLKLNIADTIGTGNTYIKNLFTPQENKRFNVKSGRMDSLYASTSAGGRVVGNGGTVVAEWGAGGGANFDFHGFAGYNLNRAGSYNARSFTDKNYVDSSLTLKTTVTSFAKNAGGDSTILLLSNGTRYAAKDSIGGGAASQWVNTANGIKYENGLVEIIADSIGTVPNDLKGLNLVTSTNATVGAPQQFSPQINFRAKAFQAGTGTIERKFRIFSKVNNADNKSMLMFQRENAGSYEDVLGVGQNKDGGSERSINVSDRGYFGGSSTIGSESSMAFVRGFFGSRFRDESGISAQFSGLGYGSYINTGTAFGLAISANAGSATVASAILELNSTTKGILIPRMTLTQRNAIASPAAGLQVIVTGETGGEFLSFYNSSTAAWQRVVKLNSAGVLTTTNSIISGQRLAVSGNDASQLTGAVVTLGYESSNGGYGAIGSYDYGTATNKPLSIGQNTERVLIGSNVLGNDADGVTGGVLLKGNSRVSGELSVNGSGNVFLNLQSNRTNIWALSRNSGLGVFRLYNWVTGGSPIVVFESTDNVNIGATTDVASSRLTVTSTTQGFLPPRMTTTQRNAIASPATGLQVYNTTTNTNDFYNGTVWGAIGGASGWGLTGNASAVTDFLGTTNNRTMRFRTNNVERMVIDSVGTVRVTNDAVINGLTVGRGTGNYSGNTALGFQTLFSNTSGTATDNTAIGYTAMRSNTTGGQNSAFGQGALYSNTTGLGNMAFGREALYFNTTGNQNIGIGVGALYFGGINTTAIGAYSGYFTQQVDGDDNFINNTGSNSGLYIGANIKTLNVSQTNEIIIGNDGLGLGSNTTVIGNSSTTLTALSGNVTAGGTIKTQGYTVATLPAGTLGMMAYVTDAVAPSYLGVLVGGGAIKCPVFYNGTAWVSH
jgi:hypothetical protein